MATIEIRYPHNTTLEDASTRARALMAQFAKDRADFVKDLIWPDGKHEGSMDGRGFQGKFSVGPSEVRIDIDLNLLTRAFKAKIETRLLDKLAAEFAP